jgi:uncharacterized protein (DUF1501 family)
MSGHYPTLTRRRFIGAATAVTALTLWPRAGQAAAADDTRLLVVLLRGGLDGLHTLLPVGDPHYARLRGTLVPQNPLALNSDFALHPSLKFSHGLYQRKQWLPIVAVAPPYRQRSHFEAQDCVENGTAQAGGASTGWLNRCAAVMEGAQALSITAVVPLILRGPGDAATWSPPLPQDVNPILLQRLQTLYAADPILAGPFAKAVEAQGMSAGGGTGRLPQAMGAAADFMAKPDGPRLGFVENTGWDTHSNQAAMLARKLTELDEGLRAFHDRASSIWNKTVVIVATEFGRTAAVNGTGGTDHGTGTLAMLAGGAVAGGRVAGDWPGLASEALNERRDLRATTDLRSVFKGVLATHIHVANSELNGPIFPDSKPAPALRDLVIS